MFDLARENHGEIVFLGYVAKTLERASEFIAKMNSMDKWNDCWCAIAYDLDDNGETSYMLNDSNEWILCDG